MYCTVKPNNTIMFKYINQYMIKVYYVCNIGSMYRLVKEGLTAHQIML